MLTSSDRSVLLDRLAAGADKISAAWRDLPPAARAWCPGPEAWSAQEILCHCADAEANGYARIRFLVAEVNPLIHAFDENRWAQAVDYHALPAETALSVVEALRAHTDTLVRRLPETAWERAGTHTETGRYTAEQWLRINVEHLEAHAAQVESNQNQWWAAGAPASSASAPEPGLAQPERSAHERSAHERSAHERSAHERSAHERSAHERSAYERSAYERSAYIEQYAAGAARLRAAWAAVPSEARHWRPAPGEWSAHEVVCHTADSETNAYARIRFLVAHDDPVIQGYDQEHWVSALDYAALSAESAMAAVEAVRGHTAAFIRRLPEAAWRRAGTHSESGPYSGDDWLHIYSAHLEDHARQIEGNVASFHRQRS